MRFKIWNIIIIGILFFVGIVLLSKFITKDQLLSKEVGAVLIVAFPMFYVWITDIENKNIQNKNLLVERFIEIQSKIEEGYQNLLNKIDSNVDGKDSNINEILDDISRFLSKLSISHHMIKESKYTFYQINLSRLFKGLSKLEGTGKASEEQAKKIGVFKTEILTLIVKMFDTEKLEEQLEFLTEEKVFCNIDFSKIPFIKKETFELGGTPEIAVFINCNIEIHTVQLLFSTVQDVVFKNCKFVNSSLIYKSVTTEISSLFSNAVSINDEEIKNEE